MAFEVFFIISMAGFINIVNAAVVPVAAVPPAVAKIQDYDTVPQYSYAYDVQDSITGDSKAATETRNGDIVQGSYSLIEADGTRRIVDYTADPINGFNAVVSREPAVAVAPIVAKPAAPIIAQNVAVPIATSKVVAQNYVAPAVVPAIAAPLRYGIPAAIYNTPFNYGVAPATVF